MRPASLPPPRPESPPAERGPGAPISGAVPRRTIQAVRPEEVERVSIGEAGLVLGDKYRLERPIASGGMASVWAATHVTLDRPVAVKFVDARIVADHDERLDRFLREAKVAASIRHKNVVDILDFGVHGEADAAEPYMVMELLEGEALDVRLARGPLSTEEIVRVGSQLLSGLEAVHTAGIVHRDVKPANVFVTEDGDGLFVRVIDFGISQGEGDAHDGTVIGTPEYMSPEQAFGDPLDLRSDLYSVGVLLYELLAGFLPFDAPDPRQVLALVVTGKPIALVHARPDLPALCAVVDKAMSRRSSDRYGSAREMQRALLAAMETAPPPASGDAERRARESLVTVERDLAPVGAPRSRRLGVAGATALALLVGVAGAGAWYWLATPDAVPAPAPPPSATFVAATTAADAPLPVIATEAVAAPAPVADSASPPAAPVLEERETRAQPPVAPARRRRPPVRRAVRAGTPAAQTSGASAIQRELDF